jgi:hypothetical protein
VEDQQWARRQLHGELTGAYSAVTSPTMNLNFAPATATVTGSFAGTTAQLLYALPNGCPVAAGPNTTTSGSLVI